MNRAGLALHHFYRVTAWLGKAMPVAQKAYAPALRTGKCLV